MLLPFPTPSNSSQTWLAIWIDFAGFIFLCTSKRTQQDLARLNLGGKLSPFSNSNILVLIPIVENCVELFDFLTPILNSRRIYGAPAGLENLNLPFSPFDWYSTSYVRFRGDGILHHHLILPTSSTSRNEEREREQ